MVGAERPEPRRSIFAGDGSVTGYNRGMNPPLAKKIPTTHTLHGDSRTDDYRWLQDKTDPEVIAYLNAENAYTKEIMAPTEALQKSLYDELLGRIQETDLSVPYPQGQWLYFSRTEEGKQYPIHCRRRREGVGSGEWDSPFPTPHYHSLFPLPPSPLPTPPSPSSSM